MGHSNSLLIYGDFHIIFCALGFYAKNILWNKPTITESIKDTNKRFKNISIKCVKQLYINISTKIYIEKNET